MLFNSLAYVIFLPFVFLVYWAIPQKNRWFLLLISSYYFYMSWNAKYVVLILGMTIISYYAGILLEQAKSVHLKKAIVYGTAISCIGVLFVFKYLPFALSSVYSIMNVFSIRLHPITVKLLLPVGISFYTFQTLSYVIDVYRGDITAEKHFGYYATFISFFPQLVAGPIERTENLLPQIKAEHVFSYHQAVHGAFLMLWGYYKKVVIADTLAPYVDAVYANMGNYSGFSMIIVVFFFTLQIYCDFSGYSDIAIGTAKLLGINLTTNFSEPYFSKSVKEFWSRWHISLSTWFKDYVYIPLGGNRCSKSRHYINLIVTFLLSGLWHGANWTFIVWGAVHSIAQVCEDLLKVPLRRMRQSKIGSLVSVCVVFAFCSIAWVFFRAESFSDALSLISHSIE